MKHNYIFFTFFLCALAAYAVPSQKNPRIFTRTTKIDLTSDLYISELWSPFIADSNFGATRAARLKISSKTGKSVIITSTGAWDLSSFNTKNKIIEFTGNAKLVCKPGAKILGYGGIIRFSQDSRCIID